MIVHDRTRLIAHTDRNPPLGGFRFLWYNIVRMKRSDFILNILRVPLDLAMLVAGAAGVYLLRTQVLDAYWPVLFGPELPFHRFVILAGSVSLFVVLVYAFSGLYAMKLRMTRGQEVARIIVASSAAVMLVIVIIFLRQELFNSRFLVMGYWIASMLAVMIGRTALRMIQRRLMSQYGIGAQRVLLIGNDEVTHRLERTLNADPGLGWRVVKRLNDPDIAEVASAIGNPGVDEVVLANPNYPAAKIVQLVDFCHEHHVIFKFVPNIYQTLTTHYDVDAIDRIPVVELRRTSLDGWGRVFKRLFDIGAAACALIILSPLFVIIAFAIKWETYGSVFVGLRRVSKNREFNLLKFRSMVYNAEELKPYLMALNERADGPLFKLKDDPRVTGVGRFIRTYRLDELPQFWNVLVGDISLVGPRPHQPDEIAKYAKHHKKVLAIKAGATGMAQISGSSDLPFEEEVALDTFYIENWSLLLDIRIVLKTVLKMFADQSAV